MIKEFEYRPALILAICFGFGIAATQSWILLFIPAIFLFIPPKIGGRWLVVLSTLLGFAFAPASIDQLKGIKPQVEIVPYSGPCFVKTVPQKRKEKLSVWLNCEGRIVRAVLPEESPVSLGDRITVMGEIGPLPEGTGAKKGATAFLRVESVSVDSHGFQIAFFGELFSSKLTHFIEKNFSERSASLLKALSVGDRDDLNREDWQSLRRSGTAHILSTSGLHVMVVAGFFYWLIRLLPLRREWQIACLLCILLVFGFAAGMKPPIIRALVMFSVIAVAYLFRKESDGLSALSLAAIANMVLDRSSVFELGFQLSLVAVGAIILFVSTPEKSGGWMKSKGVVALWTSVVTFVATLPLLGQTFGEISLVSVLANLFVVPLATVTLIALLSSFMLSFVPGLGVGLAQIVVEPLAKWMDALIVMFGSWDQFVFLFPWIPGWLILVTYLGMFALWRPNVRSC